MNHESHNEREERRAQERDLMREALLTRMIMNLLEEGLTEEAIQAELTESPIPALLRLTPDESSSMLRATARRYRTNTPEQWAREKARIEFLAGPVNQLMRDVREREDQEADQAMD